MEIYFAYGPEIGKEVMKEIAPGARFKSRAILSGYRLGFPVQCPEKKTGLVGLEEDDTAVADGIAYTVTREDLKELDSYKQPTASFRRKRVQIMQAGGGILRAWTHVALPDQGGPFKPDNACLDAILKGAEEREMAENFIADLGKLCEANAVSTNSANAASTKTALPQERI